MRVRIRSARRLPPSAGTPNPAIAPIVKRHRASAPKAASCAAARLNEKDAPNVGSGSGDAAEERAQGDGAVTVRGRRGEAQAGRGAVFRDEAMRRGSPADGAGGATTLPRRERRGCGTRPQFPRCHWRQVSPPTAERTESARGGLRRTATRRRISILRGSQGRASRPGGTGSTVAAKLAPR